MRGRSGFTLLEIMLAVLLGVLMLLLVVPSIGGLLADREAKARFEAFDDLVREAQKRSLTEHRAWVLAWEDEGVVVRPEKPESQSEEEGVQNFAFAEDEKVTVRFPAALVKKPSWVWTFWPSGTCEPAQISFESDRGHWIASYDPLTTRGTMEQSDVH